MCPFTPRPPREKLFNALGCSALGALVLNVPQPFLALSKATPEVAAKVTSYLRALSFALPAAPVAVAPADVIAVAQIVADTLGVRFEDVSFTYPGARPLYLYVKAAHVKAIKSLTPFLNEFSKAWGADGYLKAKGMVIAPEDVRTKNADVVAKMTLMDASGLK